MKKHSNIEKYINEISCSASLLTYIELASSDILDSVDKMLSFWKPGQSALKELIELSLDIKSKTGKNPLEAENTTELLRNSGFKQVLKKLKLQRFPRLSKVGASIEKKIKKAKLKHLKIDYDKNFESEGIYIYANISKKEDLDAMIEELKNLKESGLAQKILMDYVQE